MYFLYSYFLFIAQTESITNQKIVFFILVFLANALKLDPSNVHLENPDVWRNGNFPFCNASLAAFC